MDRKMRELEGRIDDLERTVGAFEVLLGRVLGKGDRGEPEPMMLRQLTAKQHVALQMLLAGKSNAEIAERFGVSDNGAKVYVRSIYKKFGVHTRSQAAVAVWEEWDAVSDGRYEAISGGIPKGWSKDWLSKSVEDDPYAEIYRKRVVVSGDEVI